MTTSAVDFHWTPIVSGLTQTGQWTSQSIEFLVGSEPMAVLVFGTVDAGTTVVLESNQTNADGTESPVWLDWTLPIPVKSDSVLAFDPASALQAGMASNNLNVITVSGVFRWRWRVEFGAGGTLHQAWAMQDGRGLPDLVNELWALEPTGLWLSFATLQTETVSLVTAALDTTKHLLVRFSDGGMKLLVPGEWDYVAGSLTVTFPNVVRWDTFTDYVNVSGVAAAENPVAFRVMAEV